MADDNTPPGAPPENTNPTPSPAPPAPPPAPPSGDPPDDPGKPNPVRQLREQLDAEKKARQAAEARAKELEREKLSEAERLRAENEELKPIRDEHGRYASALQEIYEAELAAVPEDKRGSVEALSSSGSWDQRVKALRAARSLIPADPAPKPAKPAGTSTNPPGGARGGGDAPLTMEAIRAMPLEEAMRRKAEIDKFMESTRGR